MSKDTDLLDMKLENLRSEIWEYKIYLEICAITIFFILTTNLGTTQGLEQLRKGDLLSLLIVSSSLIILIIVVYIFIRLIHLSNSGVRGVMKEKKDLNEDWLK